MYSNIRMLGLSLVSALALVGCGSSRDVEVTGEVSAPATAQGEIVVEFFDIVDSENTSVHSVTLATPGAFSEKISLEGDKLLVRAVADADGDGKCTQGELWDEIEAEIASDDTASATLSLQAGDCPAD
jgi:hypothetical protein